MKNFPKTFDPIFGVTVVKLRFHVAVTVAVAVAVGQTTARRGMGEKKKTLKSIENICFFFYVFLLYSLSAATYFLQVFVVVLILLNGVSKVFQFNYSICQYECSTQQI